MSLNRLKANLSTMKSIAIWNFSLCIVLMLIGSSFLMQQIKSASYLKSYVTNEVTYAYTDEHASKLLSSAVDVSALGYIDFLLYKKSASMVYVNQADLCFSNEEEVKEFVSLMNSIDERGVNPYLVSYLKARTLMTIELHLNKESDDYYKLLATVYYSNICDSLKGFNGYLQKWIFSLGPIISVICIVSSVYFMLRWLFLLFK